MRFSVYQESLIGARATNQDRMGYCFTRDALLLLLADGMGGHILGEVAANISMQTIAALFQRQATPALDDPQRFLQESLLAAHREIHRYRALNNLPDTPRTTIVACIVQQGQATWAHCGDSRLYWLRNREIMAKTRDHSRLELLISQGRASAGERSTHPERNKLFNCLGGPSLPVVDVSWPVNLLAGDVLFLCSDGLWSALPEETMLNQLADNAVMHAIPELVRRATRAAGKKSDNVTALGITWEAADDDMPADTFAVLTDMLPDGAVTTTIQAPRHGDPEADGETGSLGGNGGNGDISDSDIEQAIAEIRAAIGKTARPTNKT